jgi:hypothetical protein
MFLEETMVRTPPDILFKVDAMARPIITSNDSHIFFLCLTELDHLHRFFSFYIYLHNV